MGRCPQSVRKGGPGLPHLAGGERARRLAPSLRVPRPRLRRDQAAGQHEVDIGEGHGPDPIHAPWQTGDVGDVEAQPLFEKTEEVLDAEAQQVHVTQVGQRDGGRPAPKQPQRPLILGLPVGCEKLDPDHPADHCGRVLKCN